MLRIEGIPDRAPAETPGCPAETGFTCECNQEDTEFTCECNEEVVSCTPIYFRNGGSKPTRQQQCCAWLIGDFFFKLLSSLESSDTKVYAP